MFYASSESGRIYSGKGLDGLTETLGRSNIDMSIVTIIEPGQVMVRKANGRTSSIKRSRPAKDYVFGISFRERVRHYREIAKSEKQATRDAATARLYAMWDAQKEKVEDFRDPRDSTPRPRHTRDISFSRSSSKSFRRSLDDWDW